MFKDYNKYLTTTLKVYLFVLVIIFILKIVGLEYFGINYQSEFIKFIDSRLDKPIINYIVQFLLLSAQLYMYTYIICMKRPRIIEIIIVTLINVIGSCFLFKTGINTLYFIYNFLILIIYFKIKGNKLPRIILFLIFNIILMIISSLVRNNSLTEYSFTISIVLDFDYMIMLLICCELTKEGLDLCQCLHLGLSSLKKINLFQLPQKLQRNFQNNHKKFKKKSKEEKLTIIIYLILSFIWNVLTVVLILFVAFLNDTFIECIFILTSFWLSKTSFGESFHFDSMLKCFIVSNLSYYVLNRITTPLGISIIIPIFLGVGLSYVTSKFVKKTYKPLYRGMPKDVFDDTITKVADKNSIKYKICYEFYIDKVSDVSLSFKYNYSVPGIRKIRDRINQKIKKLN